MENNIWACSDLHGCAQTFKFVADYKLNLKPNDTLYLLGDLIDRGPNSKGVLDAIFELIDKGIIVYTCRGNHDQMLINAINTDDNQVLNHWLLQGGSQTLNSFKVEHPSEIPNKYIDFLISLPYFFETSDYLLSHAGFDFEAENPFLAFEKMMWIRNAPYNAKKANYRTVLHGHTPNPIDTNITEISSATKTINLDGGCVYNHIPNLGYLVGFNLINRNLVYQPNIDEL